MVERADVKAGKQVFADIAPHYVGQSKRPDKLTIRWIVDDRKFVREITNHRKGTVK